MLHIKFNEADLQLEIGQTEYQLHKSKRDDNPLLYFRTNQIFWDYRDEHQWDMYAKGITLTKKDGKYYGVFNRENYYEKTTREDIASEAQKLANSEKNILFREYDVYRDRHLDIRKIPECYNECDYKRPVYIALICSNNTFQIKLQCKNCKRKGETIGWLELDKDIVIDTMALSIRDKVANILGKN